MKAEALRRALRGLEEAGLVSTTRTKSNFGKFYKNRYKLTFPSLENEDWGVKPSLESEIVAETPSLENEGTTAGYVVPSGTSKLTNRLTSNPVSRSKGTTYLLVNASGVHRKEETMVVWKDDSGDDDIAGFGLFEEEMQYGQPKPKVDKRKSATRNQRPQSEWSPNDVAAEFSFRLGRLFPYIPGLVDTAAIRGALMKYRKQYGTTADVEVELLRMFFADDRNTKNADEQARRIHTRFLGMFQTHLKEAYSRLGTPMPKAEGIAKPVENGYLVASDGREFPTGITGRKRLAEYELKIKERV